MNTSNVDAPVLNVPMSAAGTAASPSGNLFANFSLPVSAELARISEQTTKLGDLIKDGQVLHDMAQVKAAVTSITQHLLTLSKRLDTLEHSAESSRTPLTTLDFTFPEWPTLPSSSASAMLPSLLPPAPSIRVADQDIPTAPSTLNVPQPATTTEQGSKSSGRRVQLSKAIRTVMYDMMRLQSSSHDIPDYDESYPKVDEDGIMIWRWDWDNTMKASTANKNFAAAIERRVEAERSQGKHPKVPESDWPFLKQGVETAYINLRRERDARTSDVKKAKKDQSRRRNRRRGLKEEKYKRRKVAWEHLVAINEADSEIARLGIPTRQLAENSVDLRYMSSEESEGEDAGTEKDELVTVDPQLADQPKASTSANMLSNSKRFCIRPPLWRADAFNQFYSKLDTINKFERAYPRIVGLPREEAVPPDGTPLEMVDQVWAATHPDWNLDKSSKSSKKKRKVDFD